MSGNAVRCVKDLYANLSPTADFEELWARIERHRPIVLTEIPSSVAEAADNKRAWGRKYLGEHVEVRCCWSREKFHHAAPGDVLIDGWEKYRNLWIKAGGRWITHVSAADTARLLTEIGM